jgi:hypothetical protein
VSIPGAIVISGISLTPARENPNPVSVRLPMEEWHGARQMLIGKSHVAEVSIEDELTENLFKDVRRKQ